MSIILDNLQYYLICSLLKCADSISLDDEWGEEGVVVRGGHREEEEQAQTVAPFLKSATGGYNQVIDM